MPPRSLASVVGSLAVTALAVIALVAACSSSDTGGASSRDAPPGPVVVQIVGAKGGTVTSADRRVQLEIPEGALSRDVEIKITEVPRPPTGGVGAAYDIQPDGLAFAIPAHLEYRLREEEINDELRGIRPGFVVDGDWEELPYSWLDSTTSTVQALTDHLSIHGCFKPLPTRNVTTDPTPDRPSCFGEDPRPHPGGAGRAPYTCKPQAHARCCQQNQGRPGPSCYCSITTVSVDRFTCAQNWRKTHGWYWGTLDCHAQAGGSGMDGFRCSEEWMKCCRNAGGIGPLGGWSPTGIAATQEPSCVCDLGCSGAIADWQDKLTQSQFRACVARAYKPATTPKGPDPRCVAPAPVDAGSDASRPNADGGVGGGSENDAGDDRCSRGGVGPEGTVTNAFGVAPANAGFGFPSVDLTTLVSGYAVVGASSTLQIHLTDHASACSNAIAGHAKLGAKEVWLYIYRTNVTPGVYTSQFWIQNRNTTAPGATVGACSAPPRGDGIAPSAGSVTIDTMDGARVTGSFSVTLGGQDLRATFDVPFCTPSTNLTPPLCCTP